MNGKMRFTNNKACCWWRSAGGGGGKKKKGSKDDGTDNGKGPISVDDEKSKRTNATGLDHSDSVDDLMICRPSPKNDVEEQHYQARIQSLERQLELLLCARDGGADDVSDCCNCCLRSKSSPCRPSSILSSTSSETDVTALLSSSASIRSIPAHLEHLHLSRTVSNAKQEISSLEELLSKVLAENKVLTSKVERLTAILEDTPETKVKTHLPSTIPDLDSMLALNACTPDTSSNEKPTKYVLLCRGKECKDILYKSRLNGDLFLKVKEHQEDIWRKIRKGKKKKAHCVKYASNKFGNSEFAQHIANHLYQAKSLDEVQKWWKINVKVLESENVK